MMAGRYSDGSDDFIGVRDRGYTVEVKNWCGHVSFCKDVKGPREVAALVHDLARKYKNPEYAKGLNVEKVVDCIRKNLDPDWTGSVPPDIKGSIDIYVRQHPLKYARDKWESLGTEKMKALKNEIVGLAPGLFRVLKEEVGREHSRAGRRREELDEILPILQENKKQMLYAKIEELEAALKAKDAALKEKDAALEAKDKQLAFLMGETVLWLDTQLLPGIELACQTPCNPSFQSLPEIELFLQDDVWMDEAELDQ